MFPYSLHPEALREFADAAEYYLAEASPAVAAAFMTAIDKAIRDVAEAPTRWRVVEEPGIRRYVVRRFPYVLYYRQELGRVVIYAVMHCRREPGVWKERLA